MSPLNPNSLTENELIQQCIKGKRLAQKQLFEMYAPRLMSVCARYARHHMEAEDIMQDGFIKIYAKLDTFSFKGSFEGWMKRIMVNTALKLIGKLSFKNEFIGNDQYVENSSDPSIYAKLSSDEILGVISKLPLGYKTIFNLYAIEGFSHQEIGEMLNIAASTSRSQLTKARKMLQKEIIELKKIAI